MWWKRSPCQAGRGEGLCPEQSWPSPGIADHSSTEAVLGATGPGGAAPTSQLSLALVGLLWDAWGLGMASYPWGGAVLDSLWVGGNGPREPQGRQRTAAVWLNFTPHREGPRFPHSCCPTEISSRRRPQLAALVLQRPRATRKPRQNQAAAGLPTALHPCTHLPSPTQDEATPHLPAYARMSLPWARLHRTQPNAGMNGAVGHHDPMLSGDHGAVQR